MLNGSKDISILIRMATPRKWPVQKQPGSCGNKGEAKPNKSSPLDKKFMKSFLEVTNSASPLLVMLLVLCWYRYSFPCVNIYISPHPSKLVNVPWLNHQL
jgi:hypothetical protein